MSKPWDMIDPIAEIHFATTMERKQAPIPLEYWMYWVYTRDLFCMFRFDITTCRFLVNTHNYTIICRVQYYTLR